MEIKHIGWVDLYIGNMTNNKQKTTVNLQTKEEKRERELKEERESHAASGRCVLVFLIYLHAASSDYAMHCKEKEHNI